MSRIAATLPTQLLESLAALDWSALRADQRRVLRLMQDDGAVVIRLLWRLLGREADVVDAYQECVLRLLERGARECQPPSRAYFIRAAINVALDMRRRARVRAERQADLAERSHQRMEGREPPPADGELVGRLRDAIERLPARLRDVIVLRDLAEMGYLELSRVLGLTTGTARVYRREGIVALTRLLEVDG